MNENWKKVVSEMVGPLVTYLALGIFLGYQEGLKTGLAFAAIAVVAHVGWAPFLYAYYQRKSRREAEKAERQRQAFEADAPNREIRRALAKAIFEAHSQQRVN